MIGRLCCAALVGALIIGPVAEPATAASFADGKAAYDKGQFDRSQAILRPLAQKGNAHAQFLLARQYQLGQGVEKNMVKAWVWYRRAEAKGHTEAALFRHLLEKRKLIAAADLRQARLLYGDPVGGAKEIAKTRKPLIKAKPRSRPQFAAKSPAKQDATDDKKAEPAKKEGLPDPAEKRRDMAALSKPNSTEQGDGRQPAYRPQSGSYQRKSGPTTVPKKQSAYVHPHAGISRHRPSIVPQKPRYRPQAPAWRHDDWRAERWRQRQQWRQYRQWRRMQRWRRHGYYRRPLRPHWRRWPGPHGYYRY